MDLKRDFSIQSIETSLDSVDTKQRNKSKKKRARYDRLLLQMQKNRENEDKMKDQLFKILNSKINHFLFM